jgi:hypothetical protein
MMQLAAFPFDHLANQGRLATSRMFLNYSMNLSAIKTKLPVKSSCIIHTIIFQKSSKWFVIFQLPVKQLEKIIEIIQIIGILFLSQIVIT